MACFRFKQIKSSQNNKLKDPYEMTLTQNSRTPKSLNISSSHDYTHRDAQTSANLRIQVQVITSVL